MTLKRVLWLGLIGLFVVGVVGLFAQKPFRVYPSYEPADDIPLPPDYQEKTEWTFGRLMYPNHPNAILGNRGIFGVRRWGGYQPDWREGGTSWTQDYPRADRHFALALRRLTRLHMRSVEQPVSPDDLDDFYNWPWLNAGEMGDWKLTDVQVKTLREYLLRGGFLMLDDFWGPEEYERFDETMHKVFPDHPVVDIPNDNPIFHVVYDLDDRVQILGAWCTSQRQNMMCQTRAVGTTPRWFGVFDDKGRIMVAICFNNDVGDAWEWADSPAYPEQMAGLAIRIGVNYVLYSMTH